MLRYIFFPKLYSRCLGNITKVNYYNLGICYSLNTSLRFYSSSSDVHKPLSIGAFQYKDIDRLFHKDCVFSRKLLRCSLEINDISSPILSNDNVANSWGNAFSEKYKVLLLDINASSCELDCLEKEGCDVLSLLTVDDELRSIAMIEITEIADRIIQLEKHIITLLVRLRRVMESMDESVETVSNGKKLEGTGTSVVLEVRAGAGGDEAAMFAADLLGMYKKYSNIKGWKWDVLSSHLTDRCGVKEATVCISSVSSSLDQRVSTLESESGVHRVQRVPETEASGRLHTSTATVVVLPEPELTDNAKLVEDASKDLRIEVYRSSGAGGQHVNTTNSAVRITHIPTGVVVAIQDERSQHMNKAKALKVLMAKLLDLDRQKRHAAASKLRSEKITSADRSERIRTYNYPKSRVTDHRFGITLGDLNGVLSGEELDVFILAYQQQQNKEDYEELEDWLLLEEKKLKF